MKSVKLIYKMDTIFTNSENSKTSDRRLLLKLLDKTNLKGMIDILLHQTVAFTIYGKM